MRRVLWTLVCVNALSQNAYAQFSFRNLLGLKKHTHVNPGANPSDQTTTTTTTSTDLDHTLFGYDPPQVGWDYPDNDVTLGGYSGVTSAAACATICNGLSTCVGFVIFDDGMCWPKTALAVGTGNGTGRSAFVKWQWYYVGCFNDPSGIFGNSPNGAGSNSYYPPTGYTVEQCKLAALAENQNRNVIGLQFYGQCWTGTDVNFRYAGRTRLPCSELGDASTNQIYVYQSTTLPHPEIITSSNILTDSSSFTNTISGPTFNTHNPTPYTSTTSSTDSTSAFQRSHYLTTTTTDQNNAGFAGGTVINSHVDDVTTTPAHKNVRSSAQHFAPSPPPPPPPPTVYTSSNVRTNGPNEFYRVKSGPNFNTHQTSPTTSTTSSTESTSAGTSSDTATTTTTDVYVVGTGRGHVTNGTTNHHDNVYQADPHKLIFRNTNFNPQPIGGFLQPQDNTDFYGDDIAYYAVTVQQCAAICSADAACVRFVFAYNIGEGNGCYVKNSPGGTERSFAGIVSYTRAFSPPPSPNFSTAQASCANDIANIPWLANETYNSYPSWLKGGQISSFSQLVNIFTRLCEACALSQCVFDGGYTNYTLLQYDVLPNGELNISNVEGMKNFTGVLIFENANENTDYFNAETTSGNGIESIYIDSQSSDFGSSVCCLFSTSCNSATSGLCSAPPPYPPPPPPAPYFTCPAYSAVNTNNAQRNYEQCTVTLYAGSTYRITLCDTESTGDNYLRLVKGERQLKQSDDYCGAASQITYQISTTDDYHIIEGCYDNGPCGGQVLVYDLGVTPDYAVTSSDYHTVFVQPPPPPSPPPSPLPPYPPLPPAAHGYEMPVFFDGALASSMQFTLTASTGDFVEAGSCKLSNAYCNGHTRLELYRTSDMMLLDVNEGSDAPGCGGLCAYINYTVPAVFVEYGAPSPSGRHLLQGGSTGFTVNVSCVGATCSAQPQYTVTATTPPPTEPPPPEPPALAPPPGCPCGFAP